MKNVWWYQKREFITFRSWIPIQVHFRIHISSIWISFHFFLSLTHSLSLTLLMMIMIEKERNREKYGKEDQTSLPPFYDTDDLGKEKEDSFIFLLSLSLSLVPSLSFLPSSLLSPPFWSITTKIEGLLPHLISHSFFFPTEWLIFSKEGKKKYDREKYGRKRKRKKKEKRCSFYYQSFSPSEFPKYTLSPFLSLPLSISLSLSLSLYFSFSLFLFSHSSDVYRSPMS